MNHLKMIFEDVEI